MLRALPPRWLPMLARALAGLERLLGGRDVRRAAAAWRLVFDEGGPGQQGHALLAQAAQARWLDRLAAHHARNAWRRAAAAGLARVRRGPLYLVPAFGWPHLLARCAGAHAGDMAPLEALARDARSAAQVELLGRWCLLDVAAIRTALAQRRPLHVLALLPDADGLPRAWSSPELGGGAAPEQAGAVLQRAVDLLAVLARARPDLLDWSAPRWGLRAEREQAGHPPWSRWAPWQAQAARAARRG